MVQTSQNHPGSSGRNSQQPHTRGSWAESAKGRPIATAAAVGGAVAAGAFLWSQRDRIGNQVGQWSEKMRGQQDSSSSRMSGQSSAPMGAETRSQPDIATAGTSSMASSPRATGGNSGKAQAGQTMSPSRSQGPVSSL